jgi:hypothetical protein
MKPQTKQHSIYWKSPGSPNLKKVQISKSDIKTILIYFPAKQQCTKACPTLSDCQSEVLTPRCRTQETMGCSLCEAINENVHSRTMLSVKEFLVKKFIVVMEHPTYSPNLVPYDFFLSLTMENQLKESHFGNPENVQKVTMTILNSLQKTSGNASIAGSNTGINV